jgi:hypothetical protein
MMRVRTDLGWVNLMDDNIWEYPFGDLDDDDEIFYLKPESGFIGHNNFPAKAIKSSGHLEL